MKNTIISLLLLILSGFYSMPGWAVSGFPKLLIFAFFAVCGGFSLTYSESMIKYVILTKKWGLML